MKEEDIQMLFFKTIANRARLGIVNSLKERPKSVGQICKDTGYEQSLVSHNLKLLKDTGFVEVRQEGKYRVYSLERESVAPVLDAVGRHVRRLRL